MSECWEHMRYGLRVGPWPHVIVSTTPKNRKLIKQLVKKAEDGVLRPDGSREVFVTRATTNDNPHLDKNVKQMLFEDYGGTRMGRQELYAEILDDNQNALWTEAIIDQFRIRDKDFYPDTMNRIVVGVDPAMSEEGDEHGIIVAGMVRNFRAHEDLPFAKLPHGFVMADRSLNGSPQKWAQAAVDAYHDYGANIIVAEKNNGGDLVKSNIQSLDPSIPVKLVWASHGKDKRAEPVGNMSEQGRIHMLGEFPELEEQMVEFDPIDTDDSWSPDRMDAMVWAFYELLVAPRFQQQEAQRVPDRRLRGRR